MSAKRWHPQLCRQSAKKRGGNPFPVSDDGVTQLSRARRSSAVVMATLTWWCDPDDVGQAVFNSGDGNLDMMVCPRQEGAATLSVLCHKATLSVLNHGGGGPLYFYFFYLALGMLSHWI